MIRMIRVLVYIILAILLEITSYNYFNITNLNDFILTWMIICMMIFLISTGILVYKHRSWSKVKVMDLGQRAVNVLCVCGLVMLVFNSMFMVFINS